MRKLEEINLISCSSWFKQRLWNLENTASRARRIARVGPGGRGCEGGSGGAGRVGLRQTRRNLGGVRGWEEEKEKFLLPLFRVDSPAQQWGMCWHTTDTTAEECSDS